MLYIYIRFREEFFDTRSSAAYTSLLSEIRIWEKIIAQKEAAGLWLQQNHQSEVRYENIFDKVECLTTNFLNEWDGNVQINFPLTFHMP